MLEKLKEMLIKEKNTPIAHLDREDETFQLGRIEMLEEIIELVEVSNG